MDCFGFPGLSPDWSVQTKKSRRLINFVGVLSKGHAKGESWEAGLLITKAAGEVISGTFICLLLCSLLSRLCTCMKGLVSD